MNSSCFSRWKLITLLLLGLAICLLQGPLDAGEKPNPKIELRILKNAELIRHIEANKGKVLLVSFWATWCAPCVAILPKLVELQGKYRNKGLVVISVSLNEPKQIDKVLNVLLDKKAFSPSFLVEEPSESMDHWDFIAIPTYLIFGRDGKLVEKFAVGDGAKTPFTFEDVCKAVEKQLK